MKRLLTIVITACLLCGALSGAAFADSGALRVIGLGYYTPEDFQAQYPDLPVEVVEKSYTSEGLSNIRELLLSGGWDVATIDVGSAGITLQELYDRDLVMDLSGVTALAETADALYPAVREAVTVDGHLLGIPSDIYRSVMQLSIYTPRGETGSAFEKLGFAQADIPRTFSELCDLAEAYAALPKSERKGTAFSVDCISVTSYRNFLYYLIELYTAEFCDEAGNVDYDTPAFRAALDDLRRMSDALDTGQTIAYAGDGSVYGLVCDASSALGGSSETERNLNLYIENSESIPAKMSVLIVNPGTANLEDALRFVSIVTNQVSAQFAPLLYQDADYGALARKAYEDELAILERFEDSYLETFIKKYADNPEAYYMYSRAELEDYRLNVAPYLTFRPVPRVSADTAAKTYLKNNTLDTEGLIQYLNDSMRTEEE